MLILKRLSFCLGLLLIQLTGLRGQQMQLQSSQTESYRQALGLYQKEQYGNAQLLFDDIWENDLQHDRETRASACYYAARCAMFLYNGDVQERVESFARNFELNPLVNKLYLNYANNLFSLKRYRQAADYYEKVDRYTLDEADRNEFQFKKAYSYLNDERAEEAQKLFFELKEKDSPYASSSRYYYAHLLYVDSNYTEALQNFLPLQDDESFGALVPYYMAHIYYELKNYDKLLEVGESLVEQATPSRAPEIAKLVADAFYNKKDYRNTVKYLEIFDEKGGRMSVKDHFQKGFSNYQIGNYYAAIESFNKISAGPDDLLQNTYYHLGDCYLKVGEKAKARTAFKAASEIYALPSIREESYFNYAKLAYEMNDPFQDAITTLNKFLNEFPQTPYAAEVNSYLANLYITTKNYDEALLAIERSGMDSPAMQESYQKITFYRSNEMFNAGQFAAALKKYRQCLEYPRNRKIVTLAKYWIAECHYRLLDFNQALSQFQSFRQSSGAASLPEFNRSFYHTGYCYYKAYDFENAAKDFKVFVREAPAKSRLIADALLRLGDAYLITGGYLIAADYYQQAAQANAAEADYAYFQRAKCLGLGGKKLKKIAELEKIAQRFPKSVYAEQAQFEIALTYLRLDEYDQALAALNNFKSKYPQSDRLAEVALKKGLIYSNTDQNQQAITTFKDIVTTYPGTQEAIEAIGLAELVYKREQRLNDYLDWAAQIDFVDFEESALDSTAYSAAFDQYSAQDYQRAMASFNSYLKRFENGIFSLKAHYYAAQSADQLERPDEAFKHYLAIAEMPLNTHSMQAFARVAQYRENAGQMALARDWYKKLAETAEDRSLVTTAQLGIMKTNMALGGYNEAVLYADILINANPGKTELVRQARLTKARAYYQAEKMEQALSAYEDLKAHSNGEEQAESYFRLALIKSQKEEYDSSNAEINQMIQELPSFKEYKLKGLLLMARNFWKLNDIFQANYIIDFILKTDYSPQLNQEATQLRNDINQAEAQALEAKKKLMEKQAVPITLDAEKGLQIIDLPEEEPVEMSEIKEK